MINMFNKFLVINSGFPFATLSEFLLLHIQYPKGCVDGSNVFTKVGAENRFQ